MIHPVSRREHGCLLASIFELLNGLKMVFLSKYDKYPHDYCITLLYEVKINSRLKPRRQLAKDEAKLGK